MPERLDNLVSGTSVFKRPMLDHRSVLADFLLAEAQRLIHRADLLLDAIEADVVDEAHIATLVFDPNDSAH